MNSMAFSEADYDKILKERWRRNMKDDIVEHKEKHEKEKIQKILEEKQYLERINKQLEEEKLKNKNKRLKESSERIQQYEMFLEKRKKEEDEKNRDKHREKDLTTLDFKSDENLKNFKEYMAKLNDNVDINMQKHKQFIQNNEKKNDGIFNNINTPNHNYNNLHNFQNNTNNLQYVEASKIPSLQSFQNIQNQNMQMLNHQINQNNQSLQNYRNYNNNPLDEPNTSIPIPVMRNNSPNKPNMKHIDESYNPFYVNSNRSDVTYVDYFSKKQNQEYIDYRHAQKEFLKYNREIIENKERHKQQEIEIKNRNREMMLRELDRNNQYEEALKNYHIDQQKSYKTFLDYQINEHQRNRLINESYSPLLKKSLSSLPSTNPYNNKNLNLGQSLISHNPILNPVMNYRYNKYLYKDNSSIRFAGNNIVN